MLLGNWRNIADLEESLNLHELRLILDAKREGEVRTQRFQAALKGIDLDKQNVTDAEEEFRKVQQRVEARLAGIDENTYELNQMGFDIEIEEEE